MAAPLGNVQEVAKRLLGGLQREPGSNGDDRLTFLHPSWPLALTFSIEKGRDNQDRIVCAARLPRTTGQDWHRYQLHQFVEGRKSPRRSIRADRYQSNPGAVANELDRHVLGPAIPAAMKATKCLADSYATERAQMALADDLAALCGDLRGAGCNGTETRHISLYGALKGTYGGFEIRKSGFNQLSISGLSADQARFLAKAIAKLKNMESDDV